MSGFKLGICEWAFPLPGPAGLKIAAELGLQGMELDFGDYEKGFPLSNSRIQDRYLECGAKHNIEFPSIAFNALCAHGLSKPMESVDGMIAMECLKKGIVAAAAMKIPVVQLPSFENGAINSEAEFRNTCEKLRFACRLAGEHGLIVSSENNLSPEETDRMVAEVAADNFRIFFDTQNYLLNRGYSQPDVLRRIHRHIVQLHIKDGYNGHLSSSLLGQGDALFAESAQIINDVHPCEWLILENYYNVKPLSELHPDPFELLARDIAIANSFFSFK
ncbi:MAG: sugar phosphate isomerase/epimerase [Planctomycetes bacterium]|nr:sugar phosphate isomerase/epimerase [Planctomycetota bacterium]